ncbi:hypothetical protein [Arenimonas oryziterrae]|uniref:Lysozyme inhibitor LprI N-terminal domain-containing protein n=1 Tax=Arenimonas oryziterrae DSM 21050 = YC6267 TaxID=1121015 RepID=A0A091AVV1_9GAMM|nr:hypothetical protein [Arenimonas oryziterrae]KFN42809.1 hypothetical protein N789_11810 [Arenimonas oryziterrae DSM 21050 = YC6267]
MHVLSKTLLLGLCLTAAGPLAAQTTVAGARKPAPPAVAKAPEITQCGQQTLEMCTQQRVQELKRYRDAMLRGAGVITTTANVEEARRIAAYDAWLTDIGTTAGHVADRGETALRSRGALAERDRVQFNRDYITLMTRMRTENKKHDTSAGAMKRKAEIVRTTLGNDR